MLSANSRRFFHCGVCPLHLKMFGCVCWFRPLSARGEVVLAQPSPPAAVPGEVAEAEGSDISDMDDLCTVLFQMLKHYPQGLRLCRFSDGDDIAVFHPNLITPPRNPQRKDIIVPSGF